MATNGQLCTKYYHVTDYVYDFTLKSIRNQTNPIHKFIWIYPQYFWSNLDLKDLTTNFLRLRDMVEFNIERPGKWKVRGQIVDKIDFDPKTLIILSDKFVNQLCLIVNAFQFEIMYICGK